MGFHMYFQGTEAKPYRKGLEREASCERETVWHLPKRMGEGTIQRIRIAPGFILFLANYTVNEEFTINIDYPRPGFGFGFCVSGSVRGKARGMKNELRTGGGQSHLMYFRDQTGVMTDAPGSNRQQVSILIEPEQLHSMFHDDFDRMSAHFRHTTDGTHKSFPPQSLGLTAEMHLSLNQLLNAPRDSPARRVYLESKALELVALRINSISCPQNKTKKAYRFSIADMDKIHDAAEVLKKDIVTPPTLLDLSRKVGLSHVKLNQGFRKIFDTTAFGYLRRIRMQQAKLFLETNQMNVTEATFAVGYNSLSSFSKAFYGQYGVTPHACIK